MTQPWWREACRSSNPAAVAAAEARQQQLTKPTGSLGQLEAVAVRLAGLQACERPSLERVAIGIFAGDHGVVAEGVSAYPQAVTGQMLGNFVGGGAAISVLARQLGATLELVDLGTVDPHLELPGVRHLRLGAGTANFRRGPAMTGAQLEAALQAGRDTVLRAQADGAQLFVGGEMGIGNTTAAAALASVLLGCAPDQLTGPGTGLDAAGVRHKAAVIEQALALHGLDDPLYAAALHGAGAGEQLSSSALHGAAAGERSSSSALHGAAAGERSSSSALHGAAAGERSSSSALHGLAAGEQSSSSALHGSAAGEQSSSSALHESAAVEQSRPSALPGSAAGEQRRLSTLPELPADDRQHALALHERAHDAPLHALACVGGFEIAALAGAYLACAQVGIAVLVDGFICSVAALLATRLNPACQPWLLYAHSGAEPGHARVLAALQAEPLLHLGLRLGEGSGAALAVPLLRLACALHGQMATFAEAAVADRPA